MQFLNASSYSGQVQLCEITRLSLNEAKSQNIFERRLSQVKKSDRVSSIIIATSYNQSYEPIAELAEKSGIDFYRGDLNDVGQRLFEAAQSSSSQSFLRISADSPFIDWRIVNQAISIYKQCEVDLVLN